MLDDDRQYFLPNDAVPIIHSATLLRHTAIGAAAMRRMNHVVDAERQDPAVVVTAFLETRDRGV